MNTHLSITMAVLAVVQNVKINSNMTDSFEASTEFDYCFLLFSYIKNIDIYNIEVNNNILWKSLLSFDGAEIVNLHTLKFENSKLKSGYLIKT